MQQDALRGLSQARGEKVISAPAARPALGRRQPASAFQTEEVPLRRPTEAAWMATPDSSPQTSPLHPPAWMYFYAERLGK